ncbi:sugar transport protein MST1-like [Triticum dicoccoides]|uniref:sugar transport protein MST1-like n=1 Tax=Triticum dicoccoides TaxID=85692 RepID=UPI00188FAF86|nr:sugar transport protein MST1-like [Triticum dicoccoides]
MAGGGFAVADAPSGDYGGGITFSVVVTCLMAASGGLIFGYDIGISGGVTAMGSFLEEFFPGVLRRMAAARRDQYCVYDSHVLTAFTSSLYLAGLVASLAAGRVTRAVGRQAVMLAGGVFFFVGAAVNAAAVNIAMLIVGRMLLGFGIGFTNQAAPVYLAETAPAKWRGAFTTGFQLFLGIGNLAANLTNYGAARIPRWGWRLSLGLAAVPASVILVGALLIPDTPSSLIVRGRVEQARAALRRVRGPKADVDAELEDVARAVEVARSNEQGAFRRILGREYRPHLVMAVTVPLFQQLTGVIVIAFFSPVLFQTAGFGSNAALMGAVILGAVNLGSALVSVATVDRYGRRPLFLAGGVVMIMCQVAVAWIMGSQIGRDGGSTMARKYSVAVLALTCVFSASFGWSWGPLTWVIPGEIFPVEVRSAGQGISVAVNLGATFVLTQTFLSMLCSFKYATFIYYAAWVAVMTAFVVAFLPETKGVPLEAMGAVWARHWYWGRFVKVQQPAKNTDALIN